MDRIGDIIIEFHYYQIVFQLLLLLFKQWKMNNKTNKIKISLSLSLSFLEFSHLESD